MGQEAAPFASLHRTGPAPQRIWFPASTVLRARNPGGDALATVSAQRLPHASTYWQTPGPHVGWAGSERRAPGEPPPLPALSLHSSPLSPKKRRRWTRMSGAGDCLSAPRSLEREETLNQNNKGPCAENWVMINRPSGTEASGTPAIAGSVPPPPSVSAAWAHTQCRRHFSQKRRLFREVSEQFGTEGV